MSGMFEVIANTMNEEADLNEGNRARIAATKRLERRFARYLSKASSPSELEQRIAMIDKDAREIVVDACSEHRYAKVDSLYMEILANLRKQANGSCVECQGDNDTDQCVCSSCQEKPEIREKYLDKESSFRTAADPAMGDTYTQKRVKLPTGDETALGTKGSPEINKDKVPDGGLDTIAVPSVRHPSEQQNVTDTPDYDDLRHDGPKVADPTGGPREQVNAEKPMQPEFTPGPNTDTWSDKGTQTKPVTTSSVEAKWDVV